MAGASHTVSFGSSTVSGEARQTNVGSIGSITAQTLALSLSEEPPRRQVTPDSTCPFPRDVNYISREGVFEKLDEILVESTEYRWAALYGLGGIGKSQIAIEYFYRIRDNDPSIWVFWMYASSVETVKQSFKAAAQRLGLPGHEDPKADIFELLEQWLSEKHNGQWLVILDNADEANVLTDRIPVNDSTSSGPGRSILSYIPKRPHGRVLVTSRDKKTASTLVPVYSSLIRVDHMNEKEALALFNSRIKDIAQEEGLARELVSALEFVPLAVSQAGAYIQQQGELYSIKEYLEEFRASESNQTTLLNQQNEELRRDSQVPNSVILAWEISFRQLEKTKTNAVDLLYLMSVLHRQNIPLELVRMYDTIKTRNALALLEAFSFISLSRPSQTLFSDDERILMLHRLIQLATKKWLEARDVLTYWRAVGLQRVSKLLPTDPSYEYWDLCSMLLSHAHEVLQCDASDDRGVETYRGNLLRKLAHYDIEMGNYDQALRNATKCEKIFRAYFSDDDDSVLGAISTVASASLLQGHWKKAEQLYVQVIEADKAKFGADHPNTLTKMTNLAAVYYNQGRWDVAEQLEVQVLETRKAKLGADHPDTWTSLHNLASTYWYQRRWEKAEQLYIQVIEMKEARLGVDDLATLTSMHNLAFTYGNQGRWDEAEQLGMQVTARRLAKLGTDHPDTLGSMHNLAYTYQKSGRVQQGIDLMREVVHTRTRRLGKDHPSTVQSHLALSSWESSPRHRSNSPGS